VEPSALYPITRGHFKHSSLELEDGELSGWQSEKRYYKKINLNGDEIEISGQIDGINKENGTTELVDFKTTTDKAVYFLRQLKDDNVMQLNCYRWLVDFPVDKLTVVTLTMALCVESGKQFTIENYETSEPVKTGHKNLISKKLIKKYGKNPKSTSGVWQTVWNSPEIPILSDEKVEAYIFPRAQMLHDGYTKDVVPPESECPKWKCVPKWCNVYDKCHKLSSKGE
jgi:hypothetical protein